MIGRLARWAKHPEAAVAAALGVAALLIVNDAALRHRARVARPAARLKKPPRYAAPPVA